MTTIKDRLRNLTCEVTTDDDMVTGSYRGSEGLRLILDRDIEEHYNELTLAETVESVLIEVAHVLHIERRAIVTDVFPRMADSAQPFTRAALRRQVIAEQVEKVTVQGQSSRGWVVIERCGYYDYLVAIGKGALSKLGPEKLANEILVACKAANAELSKQIRKIRDREYSSRETTEEEVIRGRKH